MRVREFDQVIQQGTYTGWQKLLRVLPRELMDKRFERDISDCGFA
jgi:hypothetical protein